MQRKRLLTLVSSCGVYTSFTTTNLEAEAKKGDGRESEAKTASVMETGEAMELADAAMEAAEEARKLAADLLAMIEVRKKAIEAENKIDEYANEKKTEKEATVC